MFLLRTEKFEVRTTSSAILAFELPELSHINGKEKHFKNQSSGQTTY
jgi:hypothetical protein